MKFQTTLAFTLLLLIAMVGAGTVSALYGFTLGYEALQGVKQPENNPTQQLIRSRKTDGKATTETGLQLLSEREVIVAVYDKIYDQEQALKKQKQAETKPKSSFVKLPETAAPNDAKPKAKSPFPLSQSSGNVTLEITDGRILGNYWVMDVSIKNDSRQAVNFLYNFLELKDDQGQIISAQTEELPTEIPANNQKYAGQIRIPAVILAQSKSLSLTLEDYPNREVSLAIADIPVVR